MRSRRPRSPNISNFTEQAGHVETCSLRAGSQCLADDVAFLDVNTLGEAFRRRNLSPVDVARGLDRADRGAGPAGQRRGPSGSGRNALAMAEAAEARYRAGAPLSALDGVPVTIKDLSAVAGWPRRRGSLALDPVRPANEDTPCVARLREAGAVFLAKTGTPEAGCKVVTRSPVHGVTANPYDTTRTPGGSSGGAAAALALGFGPLAVGSDGAGSIRIPASSTECVRPQAGLRPGAGFPPDPDMPHSVVGPMARTVADAALMLDIMSRPEPARSASPGRCRSRMPRDLANPNLSGLRVAISPRLGCTAPLIDREVDALVAEAGPLLADAGAIGHAVTIRSGRSTRSSRSRSSGRRPARMTVDGFAPDKQALLDPLLQRVAIAGRATGLVAHQRALEQRLAITMAAKAFFNRFDLACRARHACAALLPGPRHSRGLCGRGLELVPLHLSLEHDRSAGRLRSDRLHRNGPSRWRADHRPNGV